jgi:predicted Zn-dependent protease
MGHRLKHVQRFVAGLLVAALAFAGPAACLYGTAEAALFSFGIKDEQELGRKFEVLIRSRMPLIEDPEVKLYVQGIVDRLAASIPPQPFPFLAQVVLEPSMNAFAVPGGNVFVQTGLIAELDHESELAGVLGHELAHVTQRHVAMSIERNQVITVASLLGALAGLLLGGGQGGGALLAGSMAAGQTAMLNYSRGDETEADQMGIQYLIKAGYPPSGIISSFKKIRAKQWATGIDVPTYLSTHPDVGTRIAEMAARVQTLPPSIRNRKDDDARFLRVKALIVARYEDPDMAAQRFAKAPENDAVSQMGKGILAARRNRVPEADAAFGKALALAPDSALIRREAGRFYYTTGDKRAIRTLRGALDLDPRDLMAQFFYARALDAAGSKRDAQDYYAQVLRTVPEDSEVHYAYGRSLGESGQNFPAYLHLAYSAVYENDTRKVKTMLRQARAAARTQEDKDALARLEGVIRERSEYWTDKNAL